MNPRRERKGAGKAFWELVERIEKKVAAMPEWQKGLRPDLATRKATTPEAKKTVARRANRRHTT